MCVCVCVSVCGLWVFLGLCVVHRRLSSPPPKTVCLPLPHVRTSQSVRPSHTRSVFIYLFPPPLLLLRLLRAPAPHGPPSASSFLASASSVFPFFRFSVFPVCSVFVRGSFFREDLNASPTQSRPGGALHPSAAAGTRQMLLLTLCCTLLLVSVAPIVAHQMLTSNLSQGKVSVVMPDSQGDWEEEAARWDWRPASRVSGQQLGFYELAGDPLVVYVQFAGDTPGGEDVVGSSTLFAREDDQAIVIGQENESIVVLGHSIEVDEAQIRIPGQELLVWSWYVVGDVSTSNDYLAKLKQVAVKLGLTEEVAYRIILATPYLASSSDSRVLLQRFLDEHASLLYEKLHQPGVILP